MSAHRMHTLLWKSKKKIHTLGVYLVWFVFSRFKNTSNRARVINLRHVAYFSLLLFLVYLKLLVCLAKDFEQKKTILRERKKATNLKLFSSWLDERQSKHMATSKNKVGNKSRKTGCHGEKYSKLFARHTHQHTKHSHTHTPLKSGAEEEEGKNSMEECDW